jgi:colanic acid biosynthesis glycosyl transferase WcaI
MKILLYGLNFSPELTGIGKYTGEMAAWLAGRGHTVRVVTAPPYYPAWEVSPAYRGCAWHTEGWQGATLYRCPLYVPPQPGGIKRLLHLASFALSSLPVMLRLAFWRPQVVWVVEPALFCAPIAVAVARLCGANAWLHIQDFEVDAAFELGMLRGAFLRRLVVGAESWLMRRFDVVSTISKRMVEGAAAKGVAAEALRLLPNWVNLDTFKPKANRPPGSTYDGDAHDYRTELAIPPGAVVALYSGSMGSKQGLEVLAHAARLCLPVIEQNNALAQVKPDKVAIVFVFCGDGAGRANLVNLCVGLPNVRFMGLQSVERLPDLLATAQIHLLPQRADAADLVMPSKLTGMLASALPVVVSAQPGTELANVAQHCGLVVPPEDPVAFAKAVQALAADPALRQRLGVAGFAYAKANLDREVVLGRFEAELLGLANSG